jgi:hypothetical protein
VIQPRLCQKLLLTFTGITLPAIGIILPAIHSTPLVLLTPFAKRAFLQGSTVDYFTVLKVMSMLEKAQTDAGQKTKSFFGGYTVTHQQSKCTQNDRLYSTS